MTSSTSSDLGPAQGGLVRFPPRSELPPDVLILKLPFLGRTWYKRGVGYWCRRALGVFLLLVTLAIYAGIVFGVMNAAGTAGSPGYLAVLTAEIVFSAVASVFGFRHLRELGVSGRAVIGGSRSTRAGADANGPGSTASILGTVLLTASAILTAGFVLGALGIWLLRVPPTEQFARRVLTEQLQTRQNHPHASAQHRHKH